MTDLFSIYARDDLDTFDTLIFLILATGGSLTDYTETGNPVSFETNVAKPLSVVSAFTPVQSGSGDPSPENVRPITGFTGANVYLSPTDGNDPAKQTFAVTFPALGKNLFDKNAVTDGKALDTQNGDVMITSASHCVTDYIPVKKGEPVYIPSTSTTRRWFYNTQKQAELYLGQAGNQVFTPQADGYIRVTILKTEVNLNTYQIEYGSSATAYEPYTNTAYGGTLDLTTGVLTVDWGKKTVNDLSWTYQEQYTRFNTNIDDIKQRGGARDLIMFCSTFVPIYDSRPIADVPNNAIYSGGAKNVSIKTDEYTTEADLKENYGGASIVYPLNVPLVYQLTPAEILSLIGSNVLWSDLNGNLTVVYKKKGS